MTAWAADYTDPIDQNMYGTHPFYLDTRYYEVDSDKNTYTPITESANSAEKNYASYSHGVFLRNAHGQEVLLRQRNVTWRTLGGDIDLYFYAGPTQADVTKDYQTSTIGLPAMQQYFSLGYHQSRWGYESWNELRNVTSMFEQCNIPLETIWSDIDYMNQYRNFENDPVNFGYSEGQDFLDQLHESGRHYVPIVDAGIFDPTANNSTDIYPPFESGLNNDIWIKNPDGSIYLGTVWPGITAFPDWHHPKAGGWWSEQFANFHRNISFDGILLDMNEASSFCVGSCGSPIGTDSTSVPSGVSSSRDINYPPYTINNVQDGHDLAAHTISPNATHVDGFQEYDVHNLWGYQETNATYNALIDIFNTKRPFIITRSTFAGSGKWAGHWGGDNFSSWLYMALSIPQALSFSLFGVPMFGVDTCGFIGDTTEELCNRWMQLSAFFPFYRNHNEGATSQEPYMWPSVTEASITAMKIRYALLPYFYTLLHLAHTTGSTVMRALAWEFPNDPSLAAADRQFLVGPSLMVIPVLNENATTVSGVFPGTDEIWYDWYNQSKVAAQPGTNVSLDAPLGHIPVFLRGGSVLPLQQPALVTRDVRNSPWSIIVALSNNGTASGSLYIDDGESIQPNATTIVDFAVTQSSTLQANVIGSFKDKNPLANVTIMGVPSTLTHKVTFNGAKVGNSSITYNETTRVLVVNGLRNLTESNGAWGANWTLTW